MSQKSWIFMNNAFRGWNIASALLPIAVRSTRYSYGPPVGLVIEPMERPSTSRRTVESVLSSHTRTVRHIVSGGLMSRPARCIYEHPPSSLFLILICPRLHFSRLPFNFVTHIFLYLSCNFTFLFVIIVRAWDLDFGWRRVLRLHCFWYVTPFSLVDRHYYGLGGTCLLSILT